MHLLPNSINAAILCLGVLYRLSLHLCQGLGKGLLVTPLEVNFSAVLILAWGGRNERLELLIAQQWKNHPIDFISLTQATKGTYAPCSWKFWETGLSATQHLQYLESDWEWIIWSESKKTYLQNLFSWDFHDTCWFLFWKIPVLWDIVQYLKELKCCWRVFQELQYIFHRLHLSNTSLKNQN